MKYLEMVGLGKRRWRRRPQPAFRRYAPARGHRARVRRGAASAVSRRTVRRARRADARHAAAGTGEAVPELARRASRR